MLETSKYLHTRDFFGIVIEYNSRIQTRFTILEHTKNYPFVNIFVPQQHNIEVALNLNLKNLVPRFNEQFSIATLCKKIFARLGTEPEFY